MLHTMTLFSVQNSQG